MVLQHQAHQELAAQKRLALLEVVGVLELARLGGLRGQHDVGDVADELLAPVLRRHLLDLGAKVLLGHREVAFADVHAVDPGHHRIGRRSADDEDDDDDGCCPQPITIGSTTSATAATVETAVRRGCPSSDADRSGRGSLSEIMALSLKILFGPRRPRNGGDTRPIGTPLQWSPKRANLTKA